MTPLHHLLVVYRSPTRIYKDEEYEKTGCEMAECMAWKERGADADTLIVGLKELGKPEYHDEFDLPQVCKDFCRCDVWLCQARVTLKLGRHLYW